MATKKKEDIKPAFTKEQLLLSKRYQNKVDLVEALLKDGVTYTLEEVDEIINDFMKGKVN